MLNRKAKFVLNLFDFSYIFNHKLFKNTFIYTGSSVINRAIPFFLLPIMTRHLTPTDYSIAATFNVLLAVNVLRYLLEYSEELKNEVNKISEHFNLRECFYFEGSSGRLNYIIQKMKMKKILINSEHFFLKK